MNAPLTLIDAVEDMVAQKRTVGYKYEAEEAILYHLRLTAESYPHIVTRLDEVIGHVVPALKGGSYHGN
ncbi:hypothetical protein CJR81_004101 [Salmonella enterica subsp. enterica serovar Javiana]|nr:hypothetical protein [Salmonella enterica]EDR1539077.1 hypothetical protein [Salmonella enterica subsp. enterica serovar Javiana]EGO3302066.1 hypothetical protein [Salmonella enterica]